jgi:putative membrane protein insertion efficiency factor
MIRRVLILLVRVWQIGPSAVMPPTCRFAPSCSAYAIEALERHGAFRGGWLTLKRLLRCHPWGGSGYDPVP